MNTMMHRLTAVLLLGALALPVTGLSAQNPGKIAPQDQAAALRQSTDGMYNKKLTPTEDSLRNDVMLLRDSLDAVGGLATRLQRTAGSMPSVAASALKELQPACAAASRTVAVIRPRLQSLQIRTAEQPLQERATRVLNGYKASFASIGTLMSSCEKESLALAKTKTSTPAQLTAMATKINNGIVMYEANLRSTLNEFTIPLRPKQQPGKSGTTRQP